MLISSSALLTLFDDEANGNAVPGAVAGMGAISAGESLQTKVAGRRVAAEDDEGDLVSSAPITLARFFRHEHIFFKDLSDEVSTILADTAAMQSTSERLNEFYRTVQDDRMNRTLYVLTLVTTVFVPAQFLTGLYGMNFNTENSEYNLPELNVRYGYIYFWVFLFVTSAIMLSCLRSTFKVSAATERQSVVGERARMPFPFCWFRRRGAAL